MLNRRTFTTGVVAAAIAGTPHALEFDHDDAIRDILKRRVEVEKRAVGMAVSVVMPNRERFVTWGRERLNNDRPVTSQTLFEIGSITKVFTALLLADMARRGELALDDPVSRHLPGDFRLPVVAGRHMTLTDLATHTSGLPRFPPLPGTRGSPAWIEAIPRITLADFKSWLADLRPLRPAGAGWEYSNAGYALLGMALAHRGDRPYEELMKARVIGPLGLQDTVFQPTPAMQKRVAEGHDLALAPVAPLDVGIFVAAGALRSTPDDLSRFAAAILPGSGAAMAPDAQLLLTVRRPAPEISGVQALGWEVLHARAGREFVSKDGVSWGQAASMVFDPDGRAAIVALSNTLPDMRPSTPSGGGIGAADIARHLLRPEIPLDGQGGTIY
jgi:CubicO group peptidase (beta-lactamase class C family)